MAFDGLPAWRTLASRVGPWLLVGLLYVLLAAFLPLPESPLLLGAALALVVWMVRRYRRTGPRTE